MGKYDPSEHLPESVAQAWREVVAAHPSPARIVGPELEAYCQQLAVLRDAQSRIDAEGAVVADEKGRPVPHPALAIAAAAQNEIRKWGGKFRPPMIVKRRRGVMYDATRNSIAAAEHLADEKFDGPVKAVLTLAWLIDEAQRAGIEELQKASFGSIPTYMKTCAALQITPASVPVVGEQEEEKSSSKSGKLTAMQGGLGAAGA